MDLFEMNNMNEQELKKGIELSGIYYKLFLKSLPSWKRDLKGLGKSDEEILEEFITSAYFYGYLDSKSENLKE